MTRFERINIVGSVYNTENINYREFSYVFALGGMTNLVNLTHYKLETTIYYRILITLLRRKSHP